MSCTTSPVPDATLSENSFYVGINLQNILYGIELGLYFKTMHVFLARRRERWKCDVFYAIMSSVMLILITIRVASDGVYGQKMWLVDRGYPGGPLAYGEAHASDAYMDLGTAAVVVLQQMADALMIYRCYLVWGSVYATIVPSVLWLANLALGIPASWGLVTLWTDILAMSTGSGLFGLAYIIVSVTLNVTLTCTISYRMMIHARTARKCHEDDGLTLEALFVESALPYTLSGIAFLIVYGAGSQIGAAFLSVYTLMMSVSSQMLILRLAEGKVWHQEREGTRSGVDRSAPGERPDSVVLDQLAV